MAELVDALVSEASGEIHGSSNLLGHTILKKSTFRIKCGVSFLIFTDYKPVFQF